MLRERPARSRWDLKLTSGGLVDIEFAAQALQIVHAARGGPLHTSTGEALKAMAEAGLADAGTLAILQEALRLQSSLNQLLKLALPEGIDPEGEPAGFKALLARAVGFDGFPELVQTLATTQAEAHRAYEAVLSSLN